MKEKPILFSTDMVRAILDGKKTQTRRTNGLKEINGLPDMWEFKGFISYDTPEVVFTNRYSGGTIAIKCPYGGAGDVLWVRETWAYRGTSKHIVYKANFDRAILHLTGVWKPSIHMPKAAARIWLQVESIGVERVQDISEQDAIAEGIIHKSMNDPKVEFQHLWKSINGPDSWAHNPWVWVVKYVLSTIRKPNILLTKQPK